eukprot:sb/3465797/
MCVGITPGVYQMSFLLAAVLKPAADQQKTTGSRYPSSTGLPSNNRDSSRTGSQPVILGGVSSSSKSNKQLLLLFAVSLATVQGYYGSCQDASFQAVAPDNPVYCKSVCYRRDFQFYQLLGAFCFCANTTSCDGFDSVLDNYPVSATLVAPESGYVGRQLEVEATVSTADKSYSGNIELEMEGLFTTGKDILKTVKRDLSKPVKVRDEFFGLFQGYYGSCQDASFQAVAPDNPVYCKSVCYRRDFQFYQLLGAFCFCANTTSCDGFDSVLDNYPVSATLVAPESGYVGRQLEVEATVSTADKSYSGNIELEMEGLFTTVTCTDGHATYTHTLLVKMVYYNLRVHLGKIFVECPLNSPYGVVGHTKGTSNMQF